MLKIALMCARHELYIRNFLRTLQAGILINQEKHRPFYVGFNCSENLPLLLWQQLESTQDKLLVRMKFEKFKKVLILVWNICQTLMKFLFRGSPSLEEAVFCGLNEDIMIEKAQIFCKLRWKVIFPGITHLEGLKDKSIWSSSLIERIQHLNKGRIKSYMQICLWNQTS